MRHQPQPTPHATTNPAPVPQATRRRVCVIPGALAGPGSPITALSVLAEAEWGLEEHPFGASIYSPDGRVTVAWQHQPCPEGDNNPARWTVRAYRTHDDVSYRTHDPAWMATFTDAVPAELVAAFLLALTEAETDGIIRNPDHADTMLTPTAEATYLTMR